MPQRQYSKEQSRVSKANSRVILPIPYREYQEIASEPRQFRRWLDEMIVANPELFPVEIEMGYTLHDILPASAKLPGVHFRRIKLKAGAQQVLTIGSNDVMPYMTGYIDDVEKAVYSDIQQQLWDIYQAPDRQTFFRLIADSQQWANQALTGSALDAVHKLAAKADSFALAFDDPIAYPTSNMIDRHMIPLDRGLSASRHFHDDWRSAELHIRAWVLFHDFMPSCPRAKIRERAISPAHQLNDFIYHENRLHNLLVSASRAGLTTNHRKC